MKIDNINNQEIKIKTKTDKNSSYEKENAEITFKELIQGNCSTVISLSDNLLSENLISSSEEDLKLLKTSYKYDCLTMDRDDALFFANAIKGENYTFSVNGELLMENHAYSTQDVSKTYKSSEVSKTLTNMLIDSIKTNKPFRIDFGNDISAILRVSPQGKISAEFIPSDKIAEEYLKNNISYLQQVFENQNIPYTELSYRQRQKNKGNSEFSGKKDEGDK